MIVSMAKLEVVGPRRLLAAALEFLQREGVLELREPPRPEPSEPELAFAVTAEDLRAEEGLRGALARVDALAARLPAGGSDEDRLPLPDPRTPEFLFALAARDAELTSLEERRAALLAERDGSLRLVRLLTALAPLRAMPAPPRTRAFGLALRRERADAFPLLEAAVERFTRGAGVVQARDAGEGDLAVLVLVPASQAAAVGSFLFEQGVEELKVPERYADASPARALVLLGERLREIPREVKALERERVALSRRLDPALARARRDLAGRLARLAAAARCGETHHAFVVWGWLPSERVPALRQTTTRAFGGRVEVIERPIRHEEQGEVPVLLSNPRWLRPFQLLLSLVPLPRYGSVDPTPLLAVFYPLFIGLMIGDVGCGVLAVGIALLAIRRRWGGAFGHDIACIALACGASAIGWGVLFGELFGSLGAFVGLHPVLFERREAIVTFLALTLGVGVAQLCVGLALGVGDAARGGEWREAAGRAARFLMLCAATVLALAAAGELPPFASRLALVAIGVSLLVAVVADGPMALLEAVLSVGNVLSYARLMALGLASVMLAEVANELGRALPGAPGIALAIFLHTVNFTVGLISPGIAALRLQYVEFFEKFYREGGRAFRPFALA